MKDHLDHVKEAEEGIDMSSAEDGYIAFIDNENISC